MTQLLTKTKSKVLVIDDSFMARKLIVSYLNNDEYEVYESKTGREGLAVAEKINPDLILLDFVMPGMNGYEVYQALRCQLAFQSTPVILFSSSYDEVVKKFGFPFEGFEFLHKHATHEQVLTCIEALLSPPEPTAEPETAPFNWAKDGDITEPRLSLEPRPDPSQSSAATVDESGTGAYYDHKSNDIADALASLSQAQDSGVGETSNLSSLEDSFSIDADPKAPVSGETLNLDSVTPEPAATQVTTTSDASPSSPESASASSPDLSQQVTQTALEITAQNKTLRTLERKLEGLTFHVEQLESRLDKYLSRERPTPSLWTWLMLVTVISAVVGTLTGSLLLRSVDQPQPVQTTVPSVDTPLPTNPGQ